ncbi:hypothetical protein MX850_07605 [Erysipelothrix sp. Poltava]|nr:hypothetical protein MX850_07605 [Erysipelothrix sp. Poltava]
MTYKDLVNEGTEILDKANIYTGFARVLMLELLRDKDLDMFAIYNEEVEAVFTNEYRNKINQLTTDEPLGYVLGYEWFYGYKFVCE